MKLVNFKICLSIVFYSSISMASTVEIGQKNKQFSVSQIEVKVGDSINFKNDDGVAHNVFSTTAGQKFNLKIQKPGTAKEHVFDKKGELEVRCAIHPKMKLKVIVK